MILLNLFVETRRATTQSHYTFEVGTICDIITFDEIQYKLCCVAVHRGSGSQNGHYMTDVRINGCWWRCNDDFPSTKKCTGEYVPDIGVKSIRGVPYVLYYQRLNQV